MTKDEINKNLKRIILNGDKFNNLIEKPPLQNKQLKKGNTFYSVQVMKMWVQKHYKQVLQLAQTFQYKNIDDLCYKIHSFLFNYIQYQTDDVLQKLRSPANSWHVAREIGIDCKSYSIFASCILTCLGIKHYIRQIKQPNYNPKKFTHVYIVVPHNQVTVNLKDGYSTIDGTITSSKEPKILTKEDVFMNNDLPHIGLNGVAKKRVAKKKASPKKRVVKKKATAKKTTTKKNRKFPFE